MRTRVIVITLLLMGIVGLSFAEDERSLNPNPVDFTSDDCNSTNINSDNKDCDGDKICNELDACPKAYDANVLDELGLSGNANVCTNDIDAAGSSDSRDMDLERIGCPAVTPEVIRNANEIELSEIINKYEFNPRSEAVGGHPVMYADFIRPAGNGSSAITFVGDGNDYVEFQTSGMLFKGNDVRSLISEGYLIGVTNTRYNAQDIIDYGGEDGYAAAHQICKDTYSDPDAHICSQNEILSTMQALNTSSLDTWPSSNKKAWILGGPPGFTAGANDCSGWTAASDDFYGRTWLFNPSGKGKGSLDLCVDANSFEVACCGSRGNT